MRVTATVPVSAIVRTAKVRDAAVVSVAAMVRVAAIVPVSAIVRTAIVRPLKCGLLL